MKQHLSLSSIILQTGNGFWQITFYGRTCFQLFPRIWNQCKILRISEKEIQIFGGHWVHIWVFLGTTSLQIRKGLTNLKIFYNHF
jgi:hypothetical protein